MGENLYLLKAPEMCRRIWIGSTFYLVGDECTIWVTVKARVERRLSKLVTSFTIASVA